MLTSTCLLKLSSDLLHLYQYRKSKRQIEFMDQWKINQFSLEKPEYHCSSLSLLFCFHISHRTQHFYAAVNQFKWSIHARYCTAHTPSLQCDFALCRAAEMAQYTTPRVRVLAQTPPLPSGLGGFSRKCWDAGPSSSPLLVQVCSLAKWCPAVRTQKCSQTLLRTNLGTVLLPHHLKNFSCGWHKYMCLSRLLVLSSFFNYLLIPTEKQQCVKDKALM